MGAQSGSHVEEVKMPLLANCSSTFWGPRFHACGAGGRRRLGRLRRAEGRWGAARGARGGGGSQRRGVRAGGGGRALGKSSWRASISPTICAGGGAFGGRALHRTARVLSRAAALPNHPTPTSGSLVKTVSSTALASSQPPGASLP